MVTRVEVEPTPLDHLADCAQTSMGYIIKLSVLVADEEIWINCGYLEVRNWFVDGCGTVPWNAVGSLPPSYWKRGWKNPANMMQGTKDRTMRRPKGTLQ